MHWNLAHYGIASVLKYEGQNHLTWSLDEQDVKTGQKSEVLHAFKKNTKCFIGGWKYIF